MANSYYLGGITNTTLHFEDDKIHVEDKQDCQSILDYTHAARNHRFDANHMGGTLRHVGEVPMVEFMKACRARGIYPNPGSELGSALLEGLVRQNAAFQAAPTLRDPRIIMKGAR